MDLVAEYDYGLAIKGRFRLADGSKTFRWRLRDSREWSGLGKQLTEAELPLYRATELARRYEVLVVEGEAACDACWDHGLAATTVCGGAAQKQFGEALSVRRQQLSDFSALLLMDTLGVVSHSRLARL